MIPIVDPHACVSGDSVSLQNYLTQSQDFHILKMVAVQPVQAQNTVIDGVRDLYTLSKTRGSGGFPNKIVAFCDLLQAEAVIPLINEPFNSRLQGVYCDLSKVQCLFSTTVDGNDATALLQAGNLDVLTEHSMSLDLTINVLQTGLLDAIAVRYPLLPIIVTIDGWQSSHVANTGECKSCLSQLAKRDNVNMKVGPNLAVGEPDYDNSLSEFIDLCVQHFGFGRIMLATGNSDHSLPASFTNRWQSYVKATSTFSALQRDTVFRSNAVRIYEL